MVMFRLYGVGSDTVRAARSRTVAKLFEKAVV
jgi:hypothetical protein